jgi:hypothetical protein
MEPLWNLDLEPSKMQAPLNVLKEQASFLGKMTKNVLEAEVKKTEPLYTIQSFNKTRSGIDLMAKYIVGFSYEFVIKAPSLNYSYRLFAVLYDVYLYPIEIFPDIDIMREIGSNEEYIIANDEKKFIELLRVILSAEKTRKILSSLMSESNAM